MKTKQKHIKKEAKKSKHKKPQKTTLPEPTWRYPAQQNENYLKTLWNKKRKAADPHPPLMKSEVDGWHSHHATPGRIWQNSKLTHLPNLL